MFNRNLFHPNEGLLNLFFDLLKLDRPLGVVLFDSDIHVLRLR